VEERQSVSGTARVQCTKNCIFMLRSCAVLGLFINFLMMEPLEQVLVCLTALMILRIVVQPLVSHSDQYSHSKAKWRAEGKKKQQIRDVKRVLKNQNPRQAARLIKKINKKYESHSMITNLCKWEMAKSIVLQQCTNPQAKKFLTAAILCCITVYNTRNNVGAISAIMQFVNSEFSSNAGCVDDIWRLLMDMNGTQNVDKEDYDTLSSHADSGTDVLHQLQEAKSNWETFKNGPGFSKFHKFMCTLVACGLVEGKEYDVSLGNIELFTMNTKTTTMGAIDAMDALIQLTTYLVESGIYAFAHKSVKPFFFDDKLALELDNEYIKYNAMMEHLATGNLENYYNLTEQELEEQITSLMDRMTSAQTNLKGIAYTILNKKRENVAKWLDRVIDCRIACGTREAPFSPVIVGDSNIGKTTLTQIFSREIAARNGFNGESRYQAVIQGNDKFWTAYKGYTNVVILDDFGNTKVEYMQEDEGAKQIMIKNNQMCYAPKAGVEEKGRVPVQPKLLLINTNSDTMLSNMSVCPYSRYRRGDIYIRAQVKKEFARYVNGERKNEVDATKVRDMFTKVDEDGNTQVVYSTLPDMWEISLQKPYVRVVSQEGDITKANGKKKDKISSVQFMTVTEQVNGNSTLCENLSIFDALEVVCRMASDHYKAQRGIVAMTKKMDTDYTLCVHGCGQSEAYCCARQCKGRLESQGILEYTSVHLAQIIWKYGKFIHNSFFDSLQLLETSIITASTKWLVKHYDDFCNDAFFEISTWVPASIMDTSYGKAVAYLCFQKELRKIYVTQLGLRVLLPAGLGLLLPCLAYLYSSLIVFVCFLVNGLLFLWVSLCKYRQLSELVREELLKEIGERKDALHPVALATRERYGKYLVYGVAAATSILVALKVLRVLQSFSEDKPESLLQPNGMADVFNRDKLPNEWMGVTMSKLGKGTATEEQVRATTNRNLYTVVVRGENTQARSCALVITNGLIAIPKHNLVNGWKEMTVSRGSVSVTIPLDNANVYQCPEKDIAFVYSGKIQGIDLRKHFRLKDENTSIMGVYPSPISYVYRDPEGETTVQTTHGYWSSAIAATAGEFPGWKYTLEQDSFVGSCGAALVVRDHIQWRIGGIHLAGNGLRGAGGSICLDDINNALKSFHKFPDIADQQKISEKIIGDPDALKLQSNPSETSPLAWYTGTKQFEYLGSCKGESSFYSGVKPSLITDSVTKVMGIPNNFGPPRARPWWRPYHLDLEKRSNQPVGFKLGELLEARGEYVQTFVTAYQSLSDDIKAHTLKKPLTGRQVMFGEPGYRFVDRMNFKSALGFPYTGAKSKYCVIENDEIVDFLPWIWEEVNAVGATLCDGKRAYQPFKTSLKDEITKQFKDDGTENTKVRVFTCAPITLQILIRKYYLPVAAILSRLPLVSEQAVGINASGPDFDELITFIKKNGDETGYVAGDFSKYDLGMSADAILAAFGVMKDIAAECLDYTKEDLYMMDMIANEVANPVIAYNGEMILMTGSNPSGQNMTVYINGIVNSLYHRCVYNRLRDEYGCGGTFSTTCNATFYGDDSLFAPKKGYEHAMHFNNLSRVFKSVGIGYTPANKSDSSPDLVEIDEIDFLKRKPVFNPDLGVYMGALDVNSIAKSLHCSASDTLPPDVASGVNLDGSIREMFNHGEDAYEAWRQKVKVIASEHNIAPLILNLDVSYRQYLERYKDKYFFQRDEVDGAGFTEIPLSDPEGL